MYFWAFVALATAVTALWVFAMALRASLEVLETRVSNVEERLDRRLTALEEDFHRRAK